MTTRDPDTGFCLRDTTTNMAIAAASVSLDGDTVHTPPVLIEKFKAEERARIERVAMRVWDCDCEQDLQCGRCEFIAAIRADTTMHTKADHE